MPRITIDDREINALSSDTIIRAAARAGIEIPHFCYHPELQYVGSCRLCMVEVEKAPKLMTACSTMVSEGMVVRTATEKVKKARAAVLEFILLNHPLDCPICDKAGECPLQNNYFKYSARDSRFEEKKWRKRKAVDLGPTIVHDEERCILCTRCVRFMQDYAGSPQLIVAKRGSKNTLTTYPGQPLDDPYSLNTVDICPVGALTSKDFRFKCRAWYLKSSRSVCPFCSTGCNTVIQHRDGVAHRILPAENRDINGVFMCDHGRLSRSHINSDDRIFEPAELVSRDPAKKEKLSYDKAFETVAAKVLPAVRKGGPASLGVVLSPYLSVEEAHIVARMLSEGVRTPNFCVVPYDDGFDGFDHHDEKLIAKDKSPNAAGLAAVFEAAGIKPARCETVMKAAEAGRIHALLFIGPSFGLSRFTERYAAAFAACGFVASVASHTRGPAALSDIVIPLLLWAESTGHFINRNGVVQRYERAIAPRDPNARGNIETLSGLAAKLGAKTHFSSADSIYESLVSRHGIFKKGDARK